MTGASWPSEVDALLDDEDDSVDRLVDDFSLLLVVDSVVLVEELPLEELPLEELPLADEVLEADDVGVDAGVAVPGAAVEDPHAASRADATTMLPQR